MKKVTIHQPETYPWLGFFNKMMLADEYVILDNVQFRKNYFQNRNQFLTRQGSVFLTIPVDFKNHKIIKDITIKYDTNWQSKHLNTIKQSYGKSKYFDLHISFFEMLYSQRFDHLIDFNMTIIKYVREIFHISSPLLKASALSVEGSSTELLLNICTERGASVYISGRDGRNYLDMTLFTNAGVKVVYHDFSHPQYEQFNAPEFTPYMNTFDLLFNYSVEESKKIIETGGTFCEA